MSIYTARTIGGGADAIGTTFPVFRVGLSGPTFYTGTADPTISPPNPMDDMFHDGDIYLRTVGGSAAIWVYDTAVWTQVSSAGGGSFAGDIVMGTGAQILGDDTAGAGAPAFSFDGNVDTGMFQNSPNEISLATAGLERFIVKSDGTLASTTAGYEALVLADNDIPNRKYVEDIFLNAAGDSATGNITFTGTARLLAAAGTVALPSIGFAGDLDNGFMLDTGFGINSIGIVSGGALVGDFTPDGLRMRNGAQVIGDTGSVGTPSIAFSGDLDTGLFHDGTSGVVNFAANGVIAVSLNGTGVRAENGSATFPEFSFISDTNTGMYSDAADELSFATGGAQRLHLTSASVRGTAPFYNIDGTAAAPAVTFTSEIDTGMYRSANNRIGFSTSGVQRVLIDEAFFDVNVVIRARTSDAEAEPSYSWDGDIDTGVFHSAVDAIGFSAGGTERATISSTAITSTVPILAPSGSAGAPAYSFSADTDTGFFLATHLNVSVGSTNTWRFSTAGSLIGVSTGSNNVQGIDATVPGNITVRGGVALGGGNPGATAVFTGGTGNIGGTGGAILVRGGQGGTTGIGGLTEVVGGPGGSASGDGGDVAVTGGVSSPTGAEDGGDVVITGGAALGSGTDGIVRVASELKLVVSTKAGLPGALGAAGAPEAGLLQFVTDDAGSTAFVLAYSDAGPTWKRMDDNTNIA